MTDAHFTTGVAIVAGGSGGIGQEICRVLAEAGSAVALTYRSNAAAAEAVVTSVRQLGVQCEAAQLALENSDDVVSYVRSVVARFGRIHSVVYAAGPPLTFSYAAGIEPAAWKKVMDVDINGCFNLVHATVPHLREHRSGSLVAIITSAVEKVPVQDILSAAPKAAIEMLVRGIAKEEGRYGIRANCVGPGFIKAGLGADMLDRQGFEAFTETLRKSLPLRHFGTAEDIANAAVFLLSSKARYITGQSLAVDGGFQL